MGKLVVSFLCWSKVGERFLVGLELIEEMVLRMFK